MEILDPGHEYLLGSLDGGEPEGLVFVKREGPGYPGNIGSHSGTTMQECLRALIDRAKYVNNQIPCSETMAAIDLMRSTILLFELRAARRHGRTLELSASGPIEDEPTCASCGHIGCAGTCR
jgi:energy-converting hydrogenase Eha subunit B